MYFTHTSIELIITDVDIILILIYLLILRKEDDEHIFNNQYINLWLSHDHIAGLHNIELRNTHLTRRHPCVHGYEDQYIEH